MTFYHSSFEKIYKVRTTGECQALLPVQSRWKECHEYSRGRGTVRISQQQGSIMDGSNACCLQWWFLHWTSSQTFLASVWFFKWFLSLSLVLPLSLSRHTILSVKLYILTSQTARLTFRKGVIIKFRCRNYQNFGWLAGSEHDRPNLLSTVRRDFRVWNIFVWPKYFWLWTILPTTCWDNLEATCWAEGGVGTLSISVFLTHSDSLSWPVQCTLCPTDRHFNRQPYNQLGF